MRNKHFDNPQKIQEIIDKCEVCYLGMSDLDNKPYVLPFNFAYEEQTVFLHSAAEGKKLDILKHNPNVCIAFSTDHQLFFRNEEVACSYGMRYRSALIYGKVEFIEDFEEKARVLNLFMLKYTGKEFSYNAPAVKNVCIYKVVAEKMEGKESQYS